MRFAVLFVVLLHTACNLCSSTSDCPAPLVCSAEGQCVELLPNPQRECFDGDGRIQLRVTAPDGLTSAGRATVVIDGQVYETDANGELELTLPKGTYTIEASRDNFSGEKTIDVCGDR